MKKHYVSAGIVALLFGTNLLLIAPFLMSDFGNQPWNNAYENIEMARLFHDRLWTWNNLQYAGMPFAFIYPPLFHMLAAALPVESFGRAYHLVSGVTYALVPVALYLLSLELLGSRAISTLVAFAYSFFPSPIYMLALWRGLARGYLLGPWPFVDLIGYEDACHTAALVMVLLTIAFCWRGRWILASACTAAVFLLNWVGAVGLLILLAAVAIARSRDLGLLPSILRVLGVAGAGYGLAAFWITPRFFLVTRLLDRVVLRHEVTSTPWNWATWTMLACAAIAVAACLYRPMPAIVAFLISSVAILGVITVTFSLLGNQLLPLPHRYVPEFNAVALLLVGYLILRSEKWRHAIMAIALIAGLITARGFLTHAWTFTHPNIDTREYPMRKIADWLAQNAGSSRVLVSGELEGSLNLWTNVPQVGGTFQGISNFWVVAAKKELTLGCAPVDDAQKITELWMRALDIRFAVVHGPASPEYFHWFTRLGRFARLPVAWQNGSGDTVYRLEPPEHNEIAIVDLQQLGTIGRPRSTEDTAFLTRYVTWAEGRRPTWFRWVRPDRAEMDVDLKPNEGVLIKTNYDQGWRVSSGQAEPDPIGFLLIRGASGRQHLTLSFTGGWDKWFGWGLTLLTIILLLRRVPLSVAGLTALSLGLIAYAVAALNGPRDLETIEQSYSRIHAAVINPGGIIDAATYSPPPLVRGRAISIYGTNFGSQQDAVAVQIAGHPAKLLYHGPNSINVMLPDDAPQNSEVTVEVNGCAGNSFTIATRSP